MSKDVYNLKEHATEIIPNLWVGERFGCIYAQRSGFNTMCVLESPCHNLGCLHRRILPSEDQPAYMDAYAGIQRHVDLPRFTEAILAMDVFMAQDRPLLVHCGAGIERSPLTVAVWLTKHLGTSIDEAYKIIKDKRHFIEDRSAWLKQYK